MCEINLQFILDPSCSKGANNSQLKSPIRSAVGSFRTSPESPKENFKLNLPVADINPLQSSVLKSLTPATYPSYNSWIQSREKRQGTPKKVAAKSFKNFIEETPTKFLPPSTSSPYKHSESSSTTISEFSRQQIEKTLRQKVELDEALKHLTSLVVKADEILSQNDKAQFQSFVDEYDMTIKLINELQMSLEENRKILNELQTNIETSKILGDRLAFARVPLEYKIINDETADEEFYFAYIEWKMSKDFGLNDSRFNQALEEFFNLGMIVLEKRVKIMKKLHPELSIEANPLPFSKSPLSIKSYINFQTPSESEEEKKRNDVLEEWIDYNIDEMKIKAEITFKLDKLKKLNELDDSRNNEVMSHLAKEVKSLETNRLRKWGDFFKRKKDGLKLSFDETVSLKVSEMFTNEVEESSKILIFLKKIKEFVESQIELMRHEFDESRARNLLRQLRYYETIISHVSIQSYQAIKRFKNAEPKVKMIYSREKVLLWKFEYKKDVILWMEASEVYSKLLKCLECIIDVSREKNFSENFKAEVEIFLKGLKTYWKESNKKFIKFDKELKKFLK